ncbi:TMEM43 family protein [Meiothermus hypogaeus]|uniref:Uncharacterized protein n=2 Tax=Meiothermus hypogaeus TaxID=884155 RepID=A0A511R603_9DEIN|nr:TMEM43 family protein [Meiothermus hypogaeus]RIH78521.1 Transmembrane protein 43 [Meiothermus hypogaeus]GEM84456.1 hypothetical protein MHY01S_26220 [Meiothermus hypogaeus NBRC 106114]
MLKGTVALAGGLLLFVAAFPLLFWNEGRAVNIARALNQGASRVIAVQPQPIDPKHNRALVHLSGTASPTQALRDPILGLEVEALRLRRTVEMYQWKNVTSTEDEQSHALRWSETPVDSSNFPVEQHNPKALPFKSATLTAPSVALGDFQLDQGLTQRLFGFQPLPLDPAVLPTVEKALGLSRVALEGGYLYLPYGSGRPAEAKLGDVRVRFEYIPPTLVSVVAQQNGNRLEAQSASGATVALIRPGQHSAPVMFEQALSNNHSLTLALRVAGFALMLFGLRLAVSLLIQATRWIPLVGDLSRLGANLFAGVLALVLSLSSVALAWVIYRPLVAMGLIGLAMASLWWAQRVAQQRNQRSSLLKGES